MESSLSWNEARSDEEHQEEEEEEEGGRWLLPDKRCINFYSEDEGRERSTISQKRDGFMIEILFIAVRAD